MVFVSVQFRALCLTPELTPLQGSVDYQIEDPNGNLVLQEPNTALSSGVASGELQLTRDSTEGEWKITFQYQVGLVNLNSACLRENLLEATLAIIINEGSYCNLD